MTACPKCGNPVRPGAKFCLKCGNALATPPPAPMCPRCGSPLRPGARFCAACGYAYTHAPTQITPLPPPPPPPRITPSPAPPPVPSAPAPTPDQPTGPNGGYLLRHALVAGALFFCLLCALAGIGGYDITHPAPTPTALVVGPPGPAATLAPISTTPEVRIQIDSIGRFGLATTSGKLLTYSDDGDTNNTRVQVDGVDAIVGEDDGTFTTRPQIRGAGMIMGWSWRGIETTQEVALTAGATTRRTDTIRVRYTLTNRSPQTHQVALRVMLDTLIGGNDGVPFLLAGENAITTRAKDLRGAAVPDFIQALEREDIRNPGTMVNLALRGGDATPPDRLVLAHWPGSDAEWEYLEDEGGVGAGWGKDSSAGLYYNAKPLAPNESRVIVFYYGLGGIAAVGKVGMTVPLEVVETEKFSVIVVVMNPREGQRVTLTLPSALAFADGDTASKNVTPVPGAAYTQVSWKLRAASPADAVRLSARLDPEGDTTTQTIRIQPCGVTRPCSTAP